MLFSEAGRLRAAAEFVTGRSCCDEPLWGLGAGRRPEPAGLYPASRSDRRRGADSGVGSSGASRARGGVRSIRSAAGSGACPRAAGRSRSGDWSICVGAATSPAATGRASGRQGSRDGTLSTLSGSKDQSSIAGGALNMHGKRRAQAPRSLLRNAIASRLVLIGIK